MRGRWVLCGMVALGVFAMNVCTSLAAEARSGPLTLEQCIEIGLKKNAQILTARQQLDRSKAEALAAWSDVLPKMSTSVIGFNAVKQGLYVRQDQVQRLEEGRTVFVDTLLTRRPYSRYTYSLSFSASQNLYDGGRTVSTIRRAKESRKSAEFNLRGKRQHVVFSVKQVYYTLLKAEKLVTVLKEAVKASEQRLETIQSLRDAGSGTEADVLRARVALGHDRVNLVAAENDVLLAKSELNDILGLDVNAPIEVMDVPVSEPRIPDVEEAIRTAKTRNPDLRRLGSEAKVADHSIGVARSAYFPQIGVQVAYSRYGEELSRVYQDYDKNYGISLNTSLSYNLFDGFLKRANLARARTSYFVAKEMLAQKEREIVLAVKRALLNLEMYREILRISGESVASAREDLRYAKELYRVGSGTLLELIDAQVGLTRAQVDRVRAQYDGKIAEAQLAYAMGLPLDE